ncbi:MAG: hypothetical protein WC879_04420 [Melioribacteraceae bacterium]
MNPQKRDDFSKFIIHLTRNYKNISAENNLINILNQKCIEAINFHCLFSPLIKKMDFSDLLQKKFMTVCFTEIPLNQINKVVGDIPGRNIQLQPFGLVFWRHHIIDKGGNPALYINGSSDLKKFLLCKFKEQFENIKLFKKLKAKDSNYREIVNYFSLINIIQDNHDFSWEREWRFNGDFKFNYSDLVAIIAENPEEFLEKCSSNLSVRKVEYIKRIPIINPEWNYEEILESFALSIW